MCGVEPKFQCHVCPKRFTHKFSLKSHILLVYRLSVNSWSFWKRLYYLYYIVCLIGYPRNFIFQCNGCLKSERFKHLSKPFIVILYQEKNGNPYALEWVLIWIGEFFGSVHNMWSKFIIFSITILSKLGYPIRPWIKN